MKSEPRPHVFKANRISLKTVRDVKAIDGVNVCCRITAKWKKDTKVLVSNTKDCMSWHIVNAGGFKTATYTMTGVRFHIALKKV